MKKKSLKNSILVIVSLPNMKFDIFPSPTNSVSMLNLYHESRTDNHSILLVKSVSWQQSAHCSIELAYSMLVWVELAAVVTSLDPIILSMSATKIKRPFISFQISTNFLRIFESIQFENIGNNCQHFHTKNVDLTRNIFNIFFLFNRQSSCSQSNF